MRCSLRESLSFVFLLRNWLQSELSDGLKSFTRHTIQSTQSNKSNFLQIRSVRYRVRSYWAQVQELLPAVLISRLYHLTARHLSCPSCSKLSPFLPSVDRWLGWERLFFKKKASSTALPVDALSSWRPLMSIWRTRALNRGSCSLVCTLSSASEAK